MKKVIVVFLLLAALVGGATWYGLTRQGGTKATSPETSQRVMLARKFVESNEPKKALEVFKELDAKGVKLGEDGEAVHLMALDASGAGAEAATAAAEFLKKYPTSEHLPQAEYIQLSGALASAGSGDNGPLKQSIRDFLAKYPEHQSAVRLRAALGRQAIKEGNLTEALAEIEPVLATASDHPEIFAVAAQVGKANLDALYSSKPAPDDITHKVARGDSINKVAKANRLTDELLLKCNGISNPKNLRVGQTLRVPKVDFSLHVDIAANTMILKNHGQFFTIYKVRTGREAGTTPTGEYTILNKKSNPTWKPGNGHVYLPGDPNNELGTRWMSFQEDILGIHGTLHPETVGEYASNGCVGMQTADVEQLFELIQVGAPLTISGQQDLARHKFIPPPQVAPPQQLAKL